MTNQLLNLESTASTKEMRKVIKFYSFGNKDVRSFHWSHEFHPPTYFYEEKTVSFCKRPIGRSLIKQVTIRKYQFNGYLDEGDYRFFRYEEIA